MRSGPVERSSADSVEYASRTGGRRAGWCRSQDGWGKPSAVEANNEPPPVGFSEMIDLRTVRRPSGRGEPGRFREAVGHELANVGAVNVGGEQRNLFGDEFFGPPCVGPGRYRRKTNRLPAGETSVATSLAPWGFVVSRTGSPPSEARMLKMPD